MIEFMDIKNAEIVNCLNDYYSGCFHEVCARLEAGKTVHVYIDCIGHRRNNFIQELYRDKLKERYGKSLQIDSSTGGFSFSYYYCLEKDF